VSHQLSENLSRQGGGGRKPSYEVKLKSEATSHMEANLGAIWT